MHNETFALKVWKLNRFHTVYHYSFFLFFFSLFLLKAFSFLCLFPSLLVNFFVICSNILHSASLLGNLQLILTIMKVMKTVTGSFCSLPGPVLAALHTLPPLSKEGCVMLHCTDEENKSQRLNRLYKMALLVGA